MDNNSSDQRFSIKTIVDFLKKKNFLKGFRITYQVTWNLLLISFIGIISLMLFVGGAGAGFFASLVIDEPIRSKEEMKEDIYNYEEISEIYFGDDVYLGDLPSELERREIELKDISKHLINAVIATEDEYFFEHEGIVPKAIFRATYQEFANSSVQTGGSTLTQQLIKNQILTNEVSFARKAKEILLAMRLENFFEKEEILEAYLNIVPFGRNAHGRNIAGVQSAALGIFGVEAKDLSIPQAAYIAGLPQSPFGYTPFASQGGSVKENLEPSLNRMKTVLTRMRDKGYITINEFEDALKYDLRASLVEPTPTTISQYPELMQEVERRSIEIIIDTMLENDDITLKEIEDIDERKATYNEYYNKASRDLRSKGYKIHTTINKEIYDAQQIVVQNNNLFGGANNLGEPEEVGAVLLDNKTGAIISFVGGRDHSRESTNHATQSFRQNGSTMKPLVAYAPAFEIGALQPGYIIADTPMVYKDGGEPTNFDKNYSGIMTVREALVRSRNIPAIRAFNRVPYEYARETLVKMGVTNLISGEPFESTSIGGLHVGVTVEQNTNAYSVFANEGKLIQSYMIEKIVSKDDELVFMHDHQEEEIFSPQTTYLTLDILRDVQVSPGTARALPRMLNFSSDLAGKTGTTNFNHDSWYVGFNPNFSMGVWIGYDTPRGLNLPTGQRTQQIWASLANAAYKIDPEFIGTNEQFKMPSGIVRQSFCGISGLLPSELCREAGLVKTDLFNSKYLPKKVDDSLERVNFVMLKGEPYRAFENTPTIFTQTGISLKEDYFSDEYIFDNLPEKLGKIIPDRFPVDNGKTPAPISSAKLDGDRLKWSEHPEKNIIGYRVYQAPNGSNVFTVVNTVRSDKELSMKVNNGPYAYKLTAIDVMGRESSPSASIISGNWQQELPKEIIPDKKPDEEPKDDKKQNPNKPPKTEPIDDEVDDDDDDEAEEVSP